MWRVYDRSDRHGSTESRLIVLISAETLDAFLWGDLDQDQ